MVVDHLIDVHISRLCIDLQYNDFLLFNGELQLNIMIMLIWYTLKLNVLGSFQCRTPYFKFHLHPFKNQTARLDFPTKSSLLSYMEKRQTEVKNQHQLGDISQLRYAPKRIYLWSISLYLWLYKQNSYYKHNFLWIRISKGIWYMNACLQFDQYTMVLTWLQKYKLCASTALQVTSNNYSF